MGCWLEEPLHRHPLRRGPSPCHRRGIQPPHPRRDRHQTQTWRGGRCRPGPPVRPDRRLIRSPAVTELPVFPYHPDPVATGAVVRSEATCPCCGQARGYAYTGPVFAVEDLRGQLCPWCIADGSAAERFEAQFTDVVDDVPVDRLLKITSRTPGFAGWQQERWLVHCGDGAAFLGTASAADLANYPEALTALREDLAESWPSAQIEKYISALSKDGQPTAYLFRCRSCGIHLAYSDAT
ncbi:CbrC family protein [Streptomyces sp. NPDC044571]|uniref:CbrC family protein n=1 Tax=Streptomyces sp. NPDC044571 TaxID=3155371 RepID=UPI0033E9DF8C